MNFRERLEWLFRMVLLVFILASAAFLSAITAMRIAIHGREVSMPNLVGKNVADANSELRSSGVVLQNPCPGAGDASPRVDVLVSQGSREEAYVMPHLIGMNLADAVRRLDSVSIKRKLNSVSAPQWPHGAVIDQTPTPGARVASSFTVELTVA